jgi:hypothetical protein
MKRIVVIFLLGLSLLAVHEAEAQCAMCRRNVETNKEAGHSKVGTGLNKGILYLMSVPYIIGAVAIGVWMKRRNEQSKA